MNNVKGLVLEAVGLSDALLRQDPKSKLARDLLDSLDRIQNFEFSHEAVDILQKEVKEARKLLFG